jgi:hypothetical protein
LNKNFLKRVKIQTELLLVLCSFTDGKLTELIVEAYRGVVSRSLFVVVKEERNGFCG